jgi:hypothetical protein
MQKSVICVSALLVKLTGDAAHPFELWGHTQEAVEKHCDAYLCLPLGLTVLAENHPCVSYLFWRVLGVLRRSHRLDSDVAGLALHRICVAAQASYRQGADSASPEDAEAEAAAEEENGSSCSSKQYVK